MILPSTVTPDTSKIAPKSTAASFSLVRLIRVMINCSFSTLALGEPITHFKVFSPWQPIHTAFLGSPWHPFKLFAVASHAF